MSYYQTLGVRESANPIEILSAYKALQEAHKDSDIETQLEVNIAYQTLIHPERRKQYDKSNTQTQAAVIPFSQPSLNYNQHNYYHQNNYSNQNTPQNNALTNPVFWFIVSYCVATVLFAVIITW